MRELNIEEMNNISGGEWWTYTSGPYYGISVTGNSTYIVAGTALHSDHVVNSYGQIVFTGNDGYFINEYGVLVGVFSIPNGATYLF
jgi:bacteriocin-like protein